MVDTVEKAIYALSVTGLDQLDRAAAGLDKMAAADGRVAVAEETVTRARRTTTDGLERMIARLDARVRAEQQLQRVIDQVNRYEQEGVGTAAQRAQAIGLATQRYNDQVSALNRAGSANDNFKAAADRAGVSTNQLRFASQNLLFQINDIGTSLASGSSPFRVLAQQGGQVVQAFQQGGGVTGVLSATATSLRSLVTPTTIAVGGVTALAGAFAVLLLRAQSNAEQLRQLNLVLAQTGRTSGFTAADLAAEDARLRALGISRDLALQQRFDIARNPILNQSQGERLQTIGANIGAFFGTGPQAGFQQFTSAVNGGAEATIKLGLSLGALTVSQAAALSEATALGRGLQAQNQAIDAIEAKFKDFSRNAMDPSTKAINSFAGAWDNMLAKLANTGPVEAARKAVIELMNGIAAAAQAQGPSDLEQVFNRFGELFSPSRLFGRQPANPTFAPPGGNRVFTAPIPPAPSSGGNAWLNRNAPFPTLANPDGTPIQWTTQTAAGFDPNNPFATPLWNNGFWRSAAQISNNRWNFTGNAAGDVGGGSNLVQRDPQDALNVAKALDTLTRETQQNLEVDRKWAIEQQVANAALEERRRLLALKATPEEAERGATIAATAAREKANIELQKAATLQEAQTSGIIRTVDAFKQSEAAGYRATAEEQARIEVMQRGGDIGLRTRQILEESAASAVQAGQRQVAAAAPQTMAQEKIAEAARNGAAAQHEAEIQAAAAARTQDAVAKAEASRNPVLIAQAKALGDAALAEERRRDAAQRSTAAFAAANENERAIAAAQLQISSLGVAPEELQRRLAMLAAEQKAATDFAGEGKQRYLDTATALADINVKLASATRESERWNDTVRSVAETIDNDIVRRLQDAFSGKRVSDWGAAIRAELPGIAAQLTNALVIRPAIGSVLQGLGFGGVAATSFGTLGGGSLFGGGGSSPVLVATPNGSGGFSLSTLANGASLVNSASGGGGLFGGSGLFGNAGGFLNNTVGSSLGFASTVPALSSPQIGSLGSLIGIEPSSLGYLGTASTIPGSGLFGTGLLGSSTLTSILPFVGLAAGAGFLLSSLFGNHKPSNQSAGGNIDLVTGRITGGFAGGNSQIDSQTNQLVTAVASFSENLLKLTGGTLQGNVLLQGGVNTGFTADSSLPGFEGRFNLGRDPVAAARTVILAISSTLGGVSDTIRTVLDHISDPSELQAAIQFANTYDNLKSAADDAFKSIEDASKQDGPFAQAKQQITATFQALADEATQFGLAVDPVTAGLAEAQRRLTSDFNQSIQDQLLAATDAGRALVQEEQRAGDARLREAQAVNGNIAEVNRLNALKLDAIWQQQTQTVSQFLADLKFGPSSGLPLAGQLSAANDNFNLLLAQVLGGNLSAIGNLVTTGQSAYSISQQAYGFGPQTIALRDALIAALDQVLGSRSFASGTGYTPPGMILVGERGRELITQPGGMMVYPNAMTERMLSGSTFPTSRSFAGGTVSDPMPALMQEWIDEVKGLRSDVKVLTEISRLGLGEVDKNGKTQIAMQNKPAIVAPQRRVA